MERQGFEPGLSALTEGEKTRMGVFEFERLIMASFEGNTSCLQMSFEEGKCTLDSLVHARVGSGWLLVMFAHGG